MEARKGGLWLVPNLIAPGSPDRALAPETLERVRSIADFVVEGEKAAWRFLSSVLVKEALAAVRLSVLDEHSPAEDLPGLLAPALEGRELGLLSEAGIPCVADPGAPLVALAHDLGIRVQPLAGPSSIILALAASGLDGQHFSFLGYLPADRPGRTKALQALGKSVLADGSTRIFIETPYRNNHLLEDCLAVLPPSARLCVALGISSSEERIVSRTVAAWRAAKPLLPKEPAIFLVGRTPSLHLEKASVARNSGKPAPRR